MSEIMTISQSSIKTKKFQFALIVPIFVGLSDYLLNSFKENNCQDMIPSIQLKHLNLLFYREGISYEESVLSAKKDVKKTLEKMGFSDLKILVINYEKNK